MGASLAKQTVGVMGSATQSHQKHADDVAKVLAKLQVNLLTGGGGGVMEAVSRAFVNDPGRGGICIGIIPCKESDRSQDKEGYPNSSVELPIRTHLPYSGDKGTHELSRNHINVRSCAAVVALPGSKGTASEVSLAVRYRVPAIVYPSNALPNTPEIDALVPKTVPRTDNIDEVEEFLRRHLR